MINRHIIIALIILLGLFLVVDAMQAQLIGNSFKFSVENRIYGGISVPQRTEQPGQGKYGMAGTGWVAGTTFFFRSSAVDGGPLLSVSYGDYNADKHIGFPRLQLLRAELGAFTDIDVIANRIILFGSFGKAFQYQPFSNNGIGGTLGAAFESVKRYGVFGRYSYYNLGMNTVSMWEAGLQIRLF